MISGPMKEALNAMLDAEGTRFCGAEVTSGPTCTCQKIARPARRAGPKGDMMEDQVRRDAAPVHGIMSADRVGQSSSAPFPILQITAEIGHHRCHLGYVQLKFHC